VQGVPAAVDSFGIASTSVRLSMAGRIRVYPARDA
jgi:hypothetical protein